MERLDCPEALRERVIDGWTAHGARAHDRIAMFARFVLAAMAGGAPLDLLSDLGAAQLDQVRHAQGASLLASRFGGRSEPTPSLPAEASLPLDVARACIAATVDAVALLDARDAAGPAEVRDALASVASDASRHAEVLWRFLRWVLEQADAGTTREVVTELRDWAPPPAPATRDEDALAAFGALSPRVWSRAAHRARPIVQRAADAWA